MAIHFKFKSAKQYDSVDIGAGLTSISVFDLKNAIGVQKGLIGQDYELVLTNAQTEEGKCLVYYLVENKMKNFSDF